MEVSGSCGGRWGAAGDMRGFAVVVAVSAGGDTGQTLEAVREAGGYGCDFCVRQS